MAFIPANNAVKWNDNVNGSKTVFEGALRVRVGGGIVAKEDLPEYPNVLPQGTPCYLDEITRQVAIHYEFEVKDNASNKTKINIVKGPEGTRIKKGMALIVAQDDMNTGASALMTVTAVTPNDGYDEVTLSAAVTVKAGDMLWEANPTAVESKYYVKVKPNGLTDKELICVPGTYSVNVSSVYACEGPVILRRMPNISKVVRQYMQNEEFCFFNWALHK